MGASQHGHMATVGYDLYCRMLEDTVKLIKGDIENEPIETTIDLKIDAYIPSSYIEDEIQKIEVYKKIATIENVDDYKEIKEELEDRYSEIPDTVYNLMDIAYIKSKAKSILIEEIKESEDSVAFKFAKDKNNHNEIFVKLIEKYKDKVLLQFGSNAMFAIKNSDGKREELLPLLREIVDYLTDNS